VLTALAAGTVGGAGAGVTAQTTSVWTGKLKLWLLGAAFGGAALLGAVLVLSSRSNEPESRAPTPRTSVTAPAATVALPSAPTSAPTSADAEAAPSAAPPGPGSFAAAPAAPAEASAASPRQAKSATPSAAPRGPSEAALVDTARSIVKSNPRRALALAEQHRRLYPDGVLAQEREVIAIEALALLGRGDAARSRADEYRAKSPHSVHGQRLDSVLKPKGSTTSSPASR
jgi:hypothetical protein